MQWQATYKDGTIVTQAELDTTEKIDRSRLEKFELVKNGDVIFRCFFPNDRKLIFRRRTAISASGAVKSIVYLVGWHQNVNGVSIKAICYVHENGLVEFDDSRNDIELVKAEQ